MLSNTPLFDVVIGGAGIIGLAVARHLLQLNPSLRLAILEKEPGPAMHQSSRNSGVIHSGIYYEPGSSKAKNCVHGYKMLCDFVEEHGIPHDICGKVIAAADQEEIVRLHQLFERGKLNGLTGVQLLDEAASREAEPHVKAIASLWVPQAGIVDFGVVSSMIAERLLDANASFYYDHEITGIRYETHHVIVVTKYGDFQAGIFVNCCGLYADRVAMLTGMIDKYKVLPFRGEFYRVTGATAGMIRHLVYPVPDPRFPFLGVHFTPRLDGTLEAGPSAVLAFAREGYSLGTINAGELAEILAYTGFLKMAVKHWRKGWDEMHRSFSKKAFHKSAQQLVPSARIQDLHYCRAGVRAQCVDSNGNMINDYVLLEDERIINLVNTPSPAATSALSIGKFVAQKALEKLK